MTVNLAVLSDAELGALIRRSISEEVVEALVQNRPKALAKIAKTRRKIEKRARKERALRKTMTVLDPVQMYGVDVPALDIREETWGVLAPNTVRDPYLQVLAKMGVDLKAGPDAEPHEHTWMELYVIHQGFLGRADDGPTEQERTKIATLMTVTRLTEAEATERVLSLRTNEKG